MLEFDEIYNSLFLSTINVYLKSTRLILYITTLKEITIIIERKGLRKVVLLKSNSISIEYFWMINKIRNKYTRQLTPLKYIRIQKYYNIINNIILREKLLKC